MGVDYSTPDFNKFRKNMDEKSKEKFKKIQNIDTRINEIIKSMESSTDAIQIIEYCVEWKTLDDESPVPDIVKADAYRASKQNEKAKELFKNVIKEHPTYGWAHERYGYFLLAFAKYEEAIDHFDKVLDEDPNNMSALGGKGLALYLFKKFQEAITCYDAALKMAPNNEQFLNEKGIALGRLDKSQEAIECFDTALGVGVDNERRANILKDKGIALGRLKKYEEAIECFDTALGIDVSHTVVAVQDMLYTDILTGKMSVFFFLEKHQEALEISEQLLNINENHKMALSLKPMALDNLGKTLDAIKWMEVYEEKFDTNLNFDHWNVKAEMLDKVEKYPDSIAGYTKALSIEENKDTRKSLNAVIEKQNKLQKEDVGDEANNNEKPQWTNDPATDAQRQYIKKLGGDENAPKTKGEASEMITKLKEEN